MAAIPDDPPLSRSRGRLLLSVAFACILVIAVLVAVARAWHGVGTSLRHLSLATLAEAELVVLAGLVAGLLAWRTILIDLGSEVSVPAAARIFFTGQLGKYLPGSVWPVLTQMQMGKAAGLDRTRVAVASTLSLAISLMTGLLVGLLAVGHAVHDGPRIAALCIVVISPLVVLVARPALVTQAVDRALRLVRRPPLGCSLSRRGVVVVLTWSIAVWVCHGAQAWILLRAFGASGRALPLFATGGFALATVVGVLVLVVPAGAGAREGALVALFSTVVAPSTATAFALVSRMVFTSADAIAAALASIAVRFSGDDESDGGTGGDLATDSPSGLR
ncbi:MAG: glycosyltransferase 2 family protein [Actinomycetota bacterium]|nr:glycosyltransferase 2 family protein [Actinomycetota bacterium]